jgi:hypothetical protein
VNDGPAPVQLIQNRPKCRITQPAVSISRAEAHTVWLENIEGILDFTQAGLDLGHRQKCQEAESAFVITDHFGPEFVHATRRRYGVPELGTMIAERHWA